jgi:hypothetical protein
MSKEGRAWVVRFGLVALAITLLAWAFSFARDDPSLLPGNQPGYGARGPQ